jgi:hypothetical protein
MQCPQFGVQTCSLAVYLLDATQVLNAVCAPLVVGVDAHNPICANFLCQGDVVLDDISRLVGVALRAGRMDIPRVESQLRRGPDAAVMAGMALAFVG